jgi:hypothetical protein
VQGIGCDSRTRRHDNQPSGYKQKKKKNVLDLGTQMGARPELAALRALIPYRLSAAVAMACERGGTLPSVEEVINFEQKRLVS